MLRHSPLPPLVLGAALALGIALADPRTEPPAGARATTPVPLDGGPRTRDPARPDDPLQGRPPPARGA